MWSKDFRIGTTCHLRTHFCELEEGELDLELEAQARIRSASHTWFVRATGEAQSEKVPLPQHLCAPSMNDVMVPC